MAPKNTRAPEVWPREKSLHPRASGAEISPLPNSTFVSELCWGRRNNTTTKREPPSLSSGSESARPHHWRTYGRARRLITVQFGRMFARAQPDSVYLFGMPN